MTARSEAQRERRLREAFAAGRFVVVNGLYVEPDRQRCRKTRLAMMHAPSCRHQELVAAENTPVPRGRPSANRRSEAQRARRTRERGEGYVPLAGGTNSVLGDTRLPTLGAGSQTTSEHENQSLYALTNEDIRVEVPPTLWRICRGCGFSFYADANHDPDYCSCKCDSRPIGQNGSCFWADWEGGHCEHSDLSCTDCWPVEGRA